MKYATISAWASPLMLFFCVLSQSGVAVGADSLPADENKAITAVTRTNYAQELSKRIKLHIHAEGKISTGILIYLGEDRGSHTALIKRLLVKADGSVWDSADTNWDEKSFDIPLK